MAYRDGVGDGQTPYVNECELKAQMCIRDRVRRHDLSSAEDK